MEMVLRWNIGAQIMVYPLESDAEKLSAIEYVADNLEGRLLFDRMGGRRVLANECGEIKVVCPPGLPTKQPYRYGWGVRAAVADEWLIAEILSYIKTDESNFVLIEDFCGSPSDPKLTDGAAGPVFFYENKVLWPITQAMATNELVSKAKNWAVGQLTCFCRCSVPLWRISANISLSEESLLDICSSITQLALEVFDGEGLLFWVRTNKTAISKDGN
jgi:hypothetical protein